MTISFLSFNRVRQMFQQLTSDQEQALVRVMFATLTLTLIYKFHYSGWLGGIDVEAIYVAVVFLLLAFALFVSSYIFKKFIKTHRILSIVTDVMVLTSLLMIGDFVTASLCGGYLWVALANGLRFGRNYLYFATVLSIVSFSFVLVFNDFWLHRNVLGLGLMIWLVLLPLYVLKLLAKLEAAVVKADSANEAKSRFLANMSHEIRTPLAGIIGFSDVLRDSQLQMAERIECISLISKSGKHLLSIINDVLDISKIEENKIELEHKEFNIVNLMNDIKAIVQPQMAEKEIVFTIQYDFPFPEAMLGDPLRIKQVVINLLSNAIKFTDYGRISIHLSFDENSSSILIEVIDTGIGMTNEQSEKVFEAFQQADATTTRKYGGTGLGLSLSKQLAEKMGGDILVHSLIGVGSRFSFNYAYVPSADTKLIYSDEVIAEENVQATVLFEKVKGRILLAEDNVVNQMLLKILISETGAYVDIVDDGKKAIDKAMSEPYDLIFMDMQMPVMGGVEAIQTLRKNDYKGPIVALTANAMKEDRLLCQSAGSDGFLTKPIDREHLCLTISSYLNVDAEIKSEDAIYSLLGECEPRLKVLSLEFAQGLPDLVAKCEQLLMENKIDGLRFEIHQLIGLGGAVGYSQVTEAASQVKFALAKNNLDEAGRILSSLDNLSRRIAKGATPVEEVLPEYINQIK